VKNLNALYVSGYVNIANLSNLLMGQTVNENLKSMAPSWFTFLERSHLTTHFLGSTTPLSSTANNNNYIIMKLLVPVLVVLAAIDPSMGLEESPRNMNVRTPQRLTRRAQITNAIELKEPKDNKRRDEYYTGRARDLKGSKGSKGGRGSKGYYPEDVRKYHEDEDDYEKEPEIEKEPAKEYEKEPEYEREPVKEYEKEPEIEKEPEKEIVEDIVEEIVEVEFDSPTHERKYIIPLYCKLS